MLGRQAFHLQMPLSQATCSLKDMLHPNEGAGALMLSTQGLFRAESTRLEAGMQCASSRA